MKLGKLLIVVATIILLFSFSWAPPSFAADCNPGSPANNSGRPVPPDYCWITGSYTCDNAQVGCYSSSGGRASGGECVNDENQQRTHGFACVHGTHCVGAGTCTPNAPTCTITGPLVGYTNAPTYYTSTGSVWPTLGNISRVESWQSPTSNQSWAGFCNSITTSCSGTTTFSSGTGTYYVICKSFATYIDSTQQQCTGNQFGIPTGWADCGNQSRITVTVNGPDLTAPTFVSISATPTTPTNTNSITFTTNVKELESGLKTVNIFVNSDPNGATSGTWTRLCPSTGCITNTVYCTSASPCTCSYSGTTGTSISCSGAVWSGTTEGKHAIRVNAVDLANQTLDNQQAMLFVVDKTAPNGNTLSVSPNSPAFTSQVQITTTASDPGTQASGISQIITYINTATNGSNNGSWVEAGRCAISPCTVTWAANGWSTPSTHLIRSDIFDMAGNSRTSALTTTYQLSATYSCD